MFSPDDKLVVTGVSVKKNEGKGKLLFLDRESLETLTQLEVSDMVRFSNIFFPFYLNISLLFHNYIPILLQIYSKYELY